MRGREAPLGQPALERAARQAPRRNYGWHALPNVFAASEETEDYVAVTVERLREAFHHQIGTQLKRSAEDGRRERIVDQEQRVLLMGEFGECRDVGDFQERIGDRFGNDQLRA